MAGHRGYFWLPGIGTLQNLSSGVSKRLWGYFSSSRDIAHPGHSDDSSSCYEEASDLINETSDVEIVKEVRYSLQLIVVIAPT